MKNRLQRYGFWTNFSFFFVDPLISNEQKKKKWSTKEKVWINNWPDEVLIYQGNVIDYKEFEYVWRVIKLNFIQSESLQYSFFYPIIIFV